MNSWNERLFQSWTLNTRHPTPSSKNQDRRAKRQYEHVLCNNWCYRWNKCQMQKTKRTPNTKRIFYSERMKLHENIYLYLDCLVLFMHRNVPSQKWNENDKHQFQITHTIFRIHFIHAMVISTLRSYLYTLD